MAEYIFEIKDVLYNKETGEAVMKPKCVGELIRCKECKHASPKGVAHGQMHCHFLWAAMPEDFFCQKGERKEECES